MKWAPFNRRLALAQSCYTRAGRVLSQVPESTLKISAENRERGLSLHGWAGSSPAKSVTYTLPPRAGGQYRAAGHTEVEAYQKAGFVPDLTAAWPPSRFSGLSPQPPVASPGVAMLGRPAFR